MTNKFWKEKVQKSRAQPKIKNIIEFSGYNSDYNHINSGNYGYLEIKNKK